MICDLSFVIFHPLPFQGTILVMWHHVRNHGPQFTKYVFSGGTAAFLELGSYKLMLVMDVWYLAAAFTSAIIGLLSAFIFHKYFVFKKKEKTGKQALRYILLQSCNAAAQTALVFLFVDFMGVEEFMAKVLGIGCTVAWNFFAYKFFVYA